MYSIDTAIELIATRRIAKQSMMSKIIVRQTKYATRAKRNERKPPPSPPQWEIYVIVYCGFAVFFFSVCLYLSVVIVEETNKELNTDCTVIRMEFDTRNYGAVFSYVFQLVYKKKRLFFLVLLLL